MKEFVQDRKDVDVETNLREVAVQQEEQSMQQERGGGGGHENAWVAAMRGDQEAIEGLYATMGNSATKMLLEGPQPLAKLNPGVVNKVKESTCVDISNVTVEVDPKLDEEGKQGAAEAGERIYLSHTCQEQEKTLCHEGIHAVQGRGGSPDKGESGKSTEGRDAEQEAIEGTEAVLAGQSFVVICEVGGERLYQGGGGGGGKAAHQKLKLEAKRVFDDLNRAYSDAKAYIKLMITQTARRAA